MAELARPAVSGPPPELVSQPAPPRPGEIDSYLSYCLSAWQENVPWLASEWPSMDAVEREDNQLEWGIVEDRSSMLQRWAAEGRMTPQQDERFGALQRLIERQRPILERLFAT